MWLWEALKFGPPGLAALILYWTYGLLAEQVKQQGAIHASTKSMITRYMVFSFVLCFFSLAIAVFDNTFVWRERSMVDIAERARSIDTSLGEKIRREVDLTDNARTRQVIKNTIDAICHQTAKIYELAKKGGEPLSCVNLSN